jgi:hypothetical protein
MKGMLHRSDAFTSSLFLTSPEAAQPTAALAFRETLQLARVEPHALAFITMINSDILDGSFNERPIALGAFEARRFDLSGLLFGGHLDAHLFDGLLLLAPKIVFLQSFLTIIQRVRHKYVSSIEMMMMLRPAPTEHEKELLMCGEGADAFCEQ